MRAKSALLAIVAFAVAAPAGAGIVRSEAARDEFKRESPCPSTGKPRGACPGYVIDHVIPLCAGGPDRPSNMQWQTIEDGKAKDRVERRECRELRKNGESR